MPAEPFSPAQARDRQPAPALCHASYLGRVPYQQAWDLQAQLAADIAAGDRPPTLLLLEHPHTYTFGRRGSAQNLLWSQAELESRGVEVHWVDRGGDVTYHGPGQLVGYPIIPLGEVDADGRLPGPDYIGYLRRLEETLIRALAAYDISARREEGLTGVWVHDPAQGTPVGARPDSAQPISKIAAIGVKVDARGVSQHGFALNVDPDMSYWQGIIPCGLDDKAVIRMADLLPEPPSLQDVAGVVAQAFGDVFPFDLVWRDPLQTTG